MKTINLAYDFKYELYKNYVRSTSRLMRSDFNKVKKKYRGVKTTTGKFDRSIFDILMSTLNTMAVGQYTKYFFNSTFVFLFSAFEGDLRQICSNSKTAFNLRLGLNDLAGIGNLEKERNYLMKVVGIDLASINSDWDKIKTAQKFRNIIVHDNSFPSRNKKALAKKLGNSNEAQKMISHIQYDKATTEFRFKDGKYLIEFCEIAKNCLKGIYELIDELPTKK